LELLKCLVLEVDNFKELYERQLNVLVDYLIRHCFERTTNKTFSFENYGTCLGDIYVGSRHLARILTRTQYSVAMQISGSSGVSRLLSWGSARLSPGFTPGYLVTTPSALKNVRCLDRLLYDKLNHRTRMIRHLKSNLPPLKLYLDDIDVIITLFTRLHPIEYVCADKEIFDTVAELSKKQQRNFRELGIHSTDNTTLRIRTKGSILISKTGSPTSPEPLLDGDPDALREINTYLAQRTHYLLYLLPVTVEVLRFCSVLALVLALNSC
jgi:hypothetical protein